MHARLSEGFENRWRRLLATLRDYHGIDIDRFEETLQPLGLAARRFVVTCWERRKMTGFRGALRLVTELRRIDFTLSGFAVGRPTRPISLDVRGRHGRRLAAAVPSATLSQRPTTQRRTLEGALLAAAVAQARVGRHAGVTAA